jgi:hypothetical protein
MTRTEPVLLALLLCAVASACASANAPASCDASHGQSGQGNDAGVGVYHGPQVIGRDTLAQDLNYGSGYGNAAQLHDFVAHHLPTLNRRHLAQNEYWAAYLLYESGQPLQQRVDEGSASQIMIGSDNLVASSELR